MSPAAAVIVWGLGYSGAACLAACLLLAIRGSIPPKSNAVLVMAWRLGLVAVATGVVAHLLRLGDAS